MKKRALVLFCLFLSVFSLQQFASSKKGFNCFNTGCRKANCQEMELELYEQLNGLARGRSAINHYDSSGQKVCKPLQPQLFNLWKAACKKQYPVEAFGQNFHNPSTYIVAEVRRLLDMKEKF